MDKTGRSSESQPVPGAGGAVPIQALAQPAAFPFALPQGTSIPVIQTHISVVILTPERVYKLKKPLNLGFLDFSTPQLRRHFCIQEVAVNRRLAPEIYLGVAPVLADADGRLRFGETFPLAEPHGDELPQPAASFKGGTVVDYAVVMVRLPDTATLEYRVRSDTIAPAQLAALARYIAGFHMLSATNEHVARFGALDVIRGNWEENFTQMQPYIGRTLDAATYAGITGYIRHFMQAREALFATRIQEGRIRDCHGDLRLQHIYLLEQQGALDPRLAVLDGIEFNERFRYSDVAAEIAFPVMELDFEGRTDLARAFVEQYATETGDETLRELLPFYCCYRACVRGKVLSFQLDEAEIPQMQREKIGQQAAALFALAAHYAQGFAAPALIMIGGLMGTGKSTLAQALRREVGWTLFSSDTTRKQLAHVDVTQPLPEAFEQGLYSAEWTDRTYDALRRQAGETLAQGRSVLLDASFSRRQQRRAMADEAAKYGASTVFVECLCPQEVTLARLAARWRQRAGASGTSQSAASLASDGRPELYAAQHSRWESFAADQEAGIKHVRVSTAEALAVSVEQVMAALTLPRLACWL
ncbi:MAG: AAA family ATPase [Ktedonobacteraceae bacterium]|nr:AAA family ATPase [Ktedonobacteraceae bacterium]